MSVRGNNLDTVRRHNLRAIIGLVHRGGAVTRSQLTRETGLNRSTVAALVTELAERSFVVEADAETARTVGRPSPLVKPHPDLVAVAVNPEVDAVTVALVGLGARVVSRVRHETDGPLPPDEAVRATSALIDGLVDAMPSSPLVAGVGVAVPGLVRADDGVIALAPHLGWTDAAFGEALAAETGLDVRVGNDASLGAVAEHLFGAGRGLHDLIYLNGGASGIGGGLIAADVLLGGVGGFAGEWGHTRVVSSDPGARGGVLEDEVNRARLLEVLGLRSADQETLERAVLDSEDPAVRAETERQIGFLATALANAVNVLNPARVVLGGFLGTLLEAGGDRLADRVREQSLDASYRGVAIGRPSLGDEILLIGAAELGFRGLLDDPAGFLRAA